VEEVKDQEDKEVITKQAQQADILEAEKAQGNYNSNLDIFLVSENKRIIILF